MVKKKKVENSSEEHEKKDVSKFKHKVKALSTNYWMISTILLAVLLVGVLVMSIPFGVSKDQIGQKVVDFAESQGAESTLVSVTEESGLYKVILAIEGEEVPVYVTKDGKNLVPGLVPMEMEQTVTGDVVDNSAPLEIPKSNKPKVEAFVMSHCPYGTQIEKGLIPVANLLGDKIDFQLKFVYYAMHPGSGEVQEQLNQYCIQEEQNDKFIDYLTCFLDKGDGAGCVKSIGIDETKLAACVEEADERYNISENLNDESKWLSGRFPLFNIHAEDNAKYGIGGSPSLVINGVLAEGVGRDSASLLDVICSSFEVAPEECNTELSSASPSPGFGFSTTSGSATTATCG